MLTFLKYLMGDGPDDVTVYDQSTAEGYLHQFDPAEPDDMAIAATRDKSIHYRAATSLGEIGDARAIPALREMAGAFPDQGEFAGDIRLLEYEEGDRFVLPIFSSLFEAMAFVYTVELGEMVPLQYMRVPGSVLTHNDLSQHKVVLNPYAGASTEIQDPDIQALRKLLSDQ